MNEMVMITDSTIRHQAIRLVLTSGTIRNDNHDCSQQYTEPKPNAINDPSKCILNSSISRKLATTDNPMDDNNPKYKAKRLIRNIFPDDNVRSSR